MSEEPDDLQIWARLVRRVPGLAVLFSLSADRIIATLVIIASILLGVWMFKH